jgi:nicotinamide-nucleotide amidase
MEAEIITIGDELLIGQTIDTNSAYLGQQLGKIGISVSRKTAISDQENAILSAISESQSRVNILIVTGGLGPTKDDITKKTLCKYFDCGYRMDENVVNQLQKMFEKRGRVMLETNLVQANMPEACETLTNEVGTAPGMWFYKNNQVLISLPGVPGEVYHLMENQVIPKLQKEFNLPMVEHRTLVTVQKAESLLSRDLESFEASLPNNMGLAYLPSFNTVKLRLTQKVENISDISIDHYFKLLQQTIQEDVFCLEDIDPALHVSRYLIQQNISFSTAESCTGGWVAHRLMQAPGISGVYPGSIVAYSNEVKSKELSVPSHIFEEDGAVSEACSLAMADGVRKKFGVELGISTTGIAGPGGGTDKKPVGLVYIAVSYKENSMVKKFRMFGNREQIIQRSSNAALWMVKQILDLPTEILP